MIMDRSPHNEPLPPDAWDFLNDPPNPPPTIRTFLGEVAEEQWIMDQFLYKTDIRERDIAQGDAVGEKVSCSSLRATVTFPKGDQPRESKISKPRTTFPWKFSR